MAEISLQRPCVMSSVRQRVTAGVSEHVRVRLEAKFGLADPTPAELAAARQLDANAMEADLEGSGRSSSRFHQLIMSIATLVLAGATAYLAWNADKQIGLMKSDQRPWVGFEVISSTSARPGQDLDAVIAIKNVGRSPAMKAHASFRVDRLDTTKPISECLACSESLLLPGAGASYPVVIPGTMISTNGSTPAIFGRVDYEDASGNGYWTTICRYWEVAFSGLAACSRGDDAGEKSKK